MRASAEVGKFTDAIEGDRIRLQDPEAVPPCIFHPVFQRVQWLQLLGSSVRMKGCRSLAIACILSSIFLEIFRAERLISLKIVVKPILDGRADGHFDLGAKDIPDRLGHHMGGAVSQNVKPFFCIDKIGCKVVSAVSVLLKSTATPLASDGDGTFALFVGQEPFERLSHGNRCGDCDGLSILQGDDYIHRKNSFHIKIKAKEQTPCCQGRSYFSLIFGRRGGD